MKPRRKRHPTKRKSKPHPPARSRALLWLVAAAFFMDMLDSTILNTALPTMARDFGQNPLRMQTVVIAYSLTIALFIPISGWLADRFGTRKIFFSAILIFCTGSLCCAMAQTLEMLVLSRIFQAVGGSMMVPVGRLIIVKAYPRRELVRALNFVILPALLGPLMGPTLGGLIVTYTSWQWIFLINLPMGLIVGLAILPLLPDFKEEKTSPFDWVGSLLFGGSMVAISFALEGLGELHLSKSIVFASLGGGVLLSAFYWIHAFRVPNPLFRPKLLTYQGFTIGILGGIFARLANGSLPVLVPLLFQVGLGFSPIKSGLTTMPLFLASLVGKSIIERLLKSFGYRCFLLSNTLLLGMFILLLSTIRSTTPYPLILLHLFMIGLVNSMQFTAMNTLSIISLPREEESSGNSMLSVVIQVSVSLGMGTAAAVLGHYGREYGVSVGGFITASQPVLLNVFHKTFITMGLFSLVAALIFLWTPPVHTEDDHS